MTRPLEGIRVLDFTWAQQGPYATVMLSDMGAEIIKLEPRTGEMGRNAVPGYAIQPRPYFVAHDRGKRSIAVDVRTEKGREIALRLAARVDVVVSNMRPGVMDALGLGYDAIKEVNPRAVYACASAYGPLGEKATLPGFDIIGQAQGGIMSKTGNDGDPPTPAGAAIADQVGAIYLCAGILGGLVHAARTGEGIQVDISLYGTQVGLQSWEITEESMTGNVSGRGGPGHPLITPRSLWGSYQTADGAVVIGGVNGERFARLCEALGRPDIAERYPDDAARTANIAAIAAEVRGMFACQPSAHWLELFRKLDIIGAAVQTYTDVLNDPQAIANGYITELEHQTLGRTKVVGSPIQYNRQPTVPQGPAPELGNCTETYLEEAGYSWDEINALREAQVI